MASIKEVFRKVGVDLASRMDLSVDQDPFTYIQKMFGPDSTAKDQIWWIQNCGLCGAPDDIVKGQQMHFMHDSVDKLVKLLSPEDTFEKMQEEEKKAQEMADQEQMKAMEDLLNDDKPKKKRKRNKKKKKHEANEEVLDQKNEELLQEYFEQNDDEA